MKKLLIITLYSGESDYPLLKAALDQQTFSDWDHEVIENLPNKEAHERLYQMIEARSAEYRWFLKLDADMVFRDRECLERMIEIAEASPDCDQLTWPVADYLSGRNIYGVHLFSHRVRWKFPLPDLFVDADPAMPGRKIQFPRKADAFLLHSAFPSVEQAFRFGVHRGLKCFSGRATADQQHAQMQFLLGVWARFNRQPDQWRAAVLIGAECVRRGQIVPGSYKMLRLDAQRDAAVLIADFDRAHEFCVRYWRHVAPVRQYWLKVKAMF